MAEGEEWGRKKDFEDVYEISKKLLTKRGVRLVLHLSHAGVAQLVEHHLAKVDVESSSLFACSILREVP